MSGETAIALAAGIAAFVSVVALGRAFMPHDPMAARLKSHARRREQLRAGLIATPRRQRPNHVSLLRCLVERLKLTQSEDSRKTADQLAQAGWRSRDALVVFLGIRLILPLVLGVMTWLLVAAFGGEKLTALHQLIGAAVGVGLGAYGPTFGLKKAIAKRYQKIT